jgi:hypothetical protein
MMPPKLLKMSHDWMLVLSAQLDAGAFRPCLDETPVIPRLSNVTIKFNALKSS